MATLFQKKAAELERRLNEIATADIRKLRDLWQGATSESAPAALSARLLRHALAWQVQASALGGEAAEQRRS